MTAKVLFVVILLFFKLLFPVSCYETLLKVISDCNHYNNENRNIRQHKTKDKICYHHL